MSTLHDEIAAGLGQMTGDLFCEECGQEQPVAKGTISGYLADGWPKHCGFTMSWRSTTVIVGVPTHG